MKISKKHETKVTLTVMVLIMTCVVTFVAVTVNYGLHYGFIEKWLKMWLLGFTTALPVVLLLMPVVKRNVAKIVVD